MSEADNHKVLIIFPGAGNPSQGLYAKVYGLIERGALTYGYKSVDSTIRWPGQVQSDIDQGHTSLNFRSAVRTAMGHLRQYENAGVSFDILGRSFGTYVALKCAGSLRPQFLRRLILWGVPPFWRMWELYVRDLAATREVGKSKGVVVASELFSSLEPAESLISEVSYPVVIASGTKDIYSTPSDVAYLRALASRKPIKFSAPVHDAPHEVTDEQPSAVVGEYFSALFG